MHNSPLTTHRRSTVLIMVVALLGMLFVAGVAFLQSVTFEARQVATQQQSSVELAAVDAVGNKVFEALNRAWLAADGSPYRMNGPEVVLADGTLALPAYGELPGVHGILSPIEPHLAKPSGTDVPTLWPFTDLEAFTQGLPATSNGFSDPGPTGSFRAKNRIDLQAVADALTADPNQYPLVVESGNGGGVPDREVADADGDGIPDSLLMDITNSLRPGMDFLPPSIRGKLGERLNVPGSGGERVLLSLRLVPNGAKVDLNWSHPELLYRLLDDATGSLRALGWETTTSPRPIFTGELEEPALRQRGGLLPGRVLSPSSLQKYKVGNANFEDFLLGRFEATPGTPGNFKAQDHRWWLHSATETGLNYPLWFEIAAAPSFYPADLSGYDRRHVVTTYSTDNLFLRDGTIINSTDPDYRRGWVELMFTDASRDVNAPSYGRVYDPNGGNLDYDDYPGIDVLPERNPRLERRLGRMQLSLPYLEESTAYLGGVGEINNLPARLAANDANAIKFVRTIQDAFLLMMRNIDPSLALVQPEIPRMAAALTANLIDFADSDNAPTPVQMRLLNGTPVIPAEYVYGLERQPYITEVYTKVEGIDDAGTPVEDPAVSYSAIELYNPYDVDLDLALFTLTVGGTAVTYANPQPIPARGFAVILSTLAPAQADNVPVASDFPYPPGPSVLVTSDLPYVKANDRVELTRNHVMPPPAAVILLDRFDVGGGAFYDGTPALGPNANSGFERAMRPADRNPNPEPFTECWTATVAVSQIRAGHSLGTANLAAWKGTAPGGLIVRPVQVDFANSGNMRTAFPTTGSMLLLMKYANMDAGVGGAMPFTERLYDSAGTAPPGEKPEYQVDNGRMPVFDVGLTERVAWADLPPQPNPATERPLGYQCLPWGQYVFDYFTALPLDARMGQYWSGNSPYIAEVDQSGARVYGRININAAPWTVIAGLPRIQIDALPLGFREDVHFYTYQSDVDTAREHPIGEALAKSIVAYRDARRVPNTPALVGVDETGPFQGRDPVHFGTGPFPPLGGVPVGELRRGSGFLTVGELANVRHPVVFADDNDGGGDNDDGLDSNFDGDEITFWRSDGGVIGRVYDDDGYLGGALVGYPAENYVQAVGLLVALGDWVTTRSNVWTIYGTLRGETVPGSTPPATPALLDQRAIRFEETVDRLPSALKPGTPPRRIGPRTVGAYNDTRAQ